MRRGAAPFGNDLQDDFDVKVVGGKIVHVSKSSSTVHPASTDAHKRHSGSEDMRLKENMPASSSQNSPNSPKEPLKLPPIQQPTGRLHKNKFHSAPPKLHCPTSQLVVHPVNDGPKGISDALGMFYKQVEALQRKRPHALEDVRRSCTRLDDLRNGTILLQELVDVLFVNGISVSIMILKEFVEHNKLIVDGDSNYIFYKDFIDRITEGHFGSEVMADFHNSTSSGCESKSSKSNSPFLHRRHKRDNFYEETCSSGLPSRTVMSCPEWQSTAVAKPDNNIVGEDAAYDDTVLLSDLRSSFGGTRWGSHGDVHRLESALAKADKRDTGCLPAVVISRIFHDQCVPLRGELMIETFIHCEAAQGMIRWTQLMELIIKALSGSHATPCRSFPKRQNDSTVNSDLHTRTMRQKEVIPHDVATNNNIRQQAEELFARMSQHSRTDEPLQKLCSALYTCDPHRTGFLDVSTTIRMMRNYNVVYRMGLDMTALESFITVNSTRHRNENSSQTVPVISISSVVNQLLQKLDDPNIT